jgi:hypothetical protein
MEIKGTYVTLPEDDEIKKLIFLRLKQLGADPNNYWKYWNDVTGSICKYYVRGDYSLSKSGHYSEPQPGFSEIKYQELLGGVTVGYKFIDDEKILIASKVLDISVGILSIPIMGGHFAHNTSIYKSLSKLGLLDILCTPIYGDLAPVVEINGYTCVVEEDEVKFGCQRFKQTLIDDLINTMNENGVHKVTFENDGDLTYTASMTELKNIQKLYK